MHLDSAQHDVDELCEHYLDNDLLLRGEIDLSGGDLLLRLSAALSADLCLALSALSSDSSLRSAALCSLCFLSIRPESSSSGEWGRSSQAVRPRGSEISGFESTSPLLPEKFKQLSH